MKLIFVLCIAIILSAALRTDAQSVSGLAKIKTLQVMSCTYDEVVESLGTPIDGSIERELSEYFDFPDGRVSTIFSSGVCVSTSYSGGELIGWNLPKWVLTDVAFSPKRPLSPKAFNIRKSEFERTNIADVIGAYILRNEDTGIEYVFNMKGKIEDIEFFPSRNYDHLHCSKK